MHPNSNEKLEGRNESEKNYDALHHLSDRIFIATGLEFADSLTGAVLAAKEGCGILLVNQPIPDPVTAFLAGKSVALFTVFGGRAAVSEEIADQLIK